MTSREKNVAMILGACIGLFVAWRAGKAFMEPFFEIRADRDARLATLQDLEKKVDIAQSDLADYVRLCALMPERSEDGPQDAGDRVSNFLRQRILDLVENDPEITQFEDINLQQVRQDTYTPKGARKGKGKGKNSLPKLSVALSATGDLESIMRFMLEIYAQEDLIYITDADFDPLRSRKSKEVSEVRFTFDFETVVVERNDKLLAAAPPPKEASPDGSGSRDTDEVDEDAEAAPTDQAGVESPADDPADGGPALDGAGEADDPGEAAAQDSETAEPAGTRPPPDLGPRLAFGWDRYEELLSWKPFDAYEEPKPDPVPVVEKPPKPVRSKPRETRTPRNSEPPKEEWLVKGYFRAGKTALLILDRPAQGRSGARNAASRRRRRGSRGAEEEQKRVYKKIGDEFDEGLLEKLHRLGAVVRKKEKDEDEQELPGKGRLWFYPYGKLTSDSMLLSEAHKYREVQLQMEREGILDEPPPPADVVDDPADTES